MEICRLICQNILDTNPRDDVGKTPISTASAEGNFEIVSFLKNILSHVPIPARYEPALVLRVRPVAPR